MLSRRTLTASLGALLVTGCRRSAGSPPTSVDPCGFEGPTPGAVTGPFPPLAFRERAGRGDNPGAIADVPETDFDLTVVEGRAGVPVGQIVVIRGTVLGPDCAPVVGADLQLWQADAAGNYNHLNEGSRVSAADLDPAFGYWGHALTDGEGRFVLKTIVPGAYPAGSRWWRPPHLHWSISAPGRTRITTQSFFEGDVLDGISEIRDLNHRDHILNIRSGFEGDLSGEALQTARRRLKEEMTATFSPGESGLPTGELTFRLG